MKPNWQSAVIIIGVVGGLISLPKTAIEGLNAIHHRPQVEVVRNVPVVMTYNQKLKSIACSVGVLVYNTGNKADLISPSAVYLGVPDDQSGGLVFLGDDITLKDGEHETYKVLAEQNIPKNLTCEIPVAPSNIRGLFTRQPTHREFVLELTNKDGHKFRAVFDFDLNEELLKQLENPGGQGFIKLIDSIK